jgi:signal transduction histidine kinase
LYRIAQEALTNAARHARASTVDVCLQVADSGFLLQITDDGIGMTSAHRSGSGMGLKIMRYRASMIGARFELQDQSPRGTVVRVAGDQFILNRQLPAAQII